MPPSLHRLARARRADSNPAVSGGRLQRREWERLNCVSPRAYLGEAAPRAIATPGTVLVPHDYARERADQ